MAAKLKWEDIYKDFRRKHPKLRKEVLTWAPCNFATIEVKLKDGTILQYNYDENKVEFVKLGANYES